MIHLLFGIEPKRWLKRKPRLPSCSVFSGHNIVQIVGNHSVQDNVYNKRNNTFNQFNFFYRVEINKTGTGYSKIV
jgi:hypothetical protein